MDSTAQNKAGAGYRQGPSDSTILTIPNRLPISASKGDQNSKMAPEIPQRSHSSHHPSHPAGCLTPADTHAHIVEAGIGKLNHSPLRFFVLAVLAGVYIAFGFSICMITGGQLSPELRHEQPGLFTFLFAIFGFPLGLTIIVTIGAELYTSNVCYMTAAAWEAGRKKWRSSTVGWIKIVVLSWVYNFIGSLLLMAIVARSEVFKGKEGFVLELAHKKTSSDFGATLCKGILCNWLVCMAVYLANCAQDVTGKAVAIFLPVSAFVALGTEHCIANQYVLTLAIKLGAELTIGDIFVKNLIPATIGNAIGGAFFVASFYAAAFGKPERDVTAVLDEVQTAFSAGKPLWQSHPLNPSSVRDDCHACDLPCSAAAKCAQDCERGQAQLAVSVLAAGGSSPAVMMTPKPAGAARTAGLMSPKVE